MRTTCGVESFRRVASRGLVALTSFAVCQTSPCAQEAATSATRRSITTESEDALRAARFSLRLKDAPLSQMLRLVGRTNDIQFRFAVIPDTNVSVQTSDALLLPTLDNVLHAAGFGVVRQERHFWLVKGRQTTAATVLPNQTRAGRVPLKVVPWPATWQLWTREAPPGKGWMAPLALKIPVATVPYRGEAPRLTTPLAVPIEPPLPLSGWRTLNLDATPNALGVAVRGQSTLHGSTGHTTAVNAEAATADSATAATSRRAWLRWPFWLRRVPRGAQLRLHTNANATLWVNGARVLPHWSGTRLIEVDRLLQPGFNCLAVEWNAVAEPDENANSEAMLRYEWLFDV